ncbi:hypothetical protein [Williamsia limnetica]|uniref:hypothetical protein n=1 Tax=Williamsia limnetica TaxID=882452 RepID=UPI000D7C80A4|nr:hypothetical protein [Williamsia limnetica]
MAVPAAGGAPATSALGTPTPRAVTAIGDTLYIADGPAGERNAGTVVAVPADGSTESVTIIRDLDFPTGITAVGNTLYIADLQLGSIVSAPADGSSSPTTVVGGLNGPGAITSAGSTLYYASDNSASIYSVPIDGSSNPRTIVFDGRDEITGLTVIGNTLYYSVEGDHLGSVFSVPIDGSSAPVVTARNISGIRGLTSAGNTLYITTLRDIYSLPTDSETTTLPAPLFSYNGNAGYLLAITAITQTTPPPAPCTGSVCITPGMFGSS